MGIDGELMEKARRFFVEELTHEEGLKVAKVAIMTIVSDLASTKDAHMSDERMKLAVDYLDAYFADIRKLFIENIQQVMVDVRARYL